MPPSSSIPSHLRAFVSRAILLACAGAVRPGASAWLGVALAWLLGGVSLGAETSMVVGDRNRELGRILPLAKIPWEVVLTNASAVPVEILDVRTSCSCLRVPWKATNLPPRTRLVMRLELIAGDVSGPFTESVQFRTTDPREPTVELTLRGEVYRPVEAVPAFAMLPATPDSWKQESATLRIVNHQLEPVTVSDPVSLNDAFAGRLRTVREGFEYELEVRLTREVPNGNHYGRFQLRTSSAPVPIVEATVLVPGLSAVAVGPRRLRVAAVGTNPAVATPIYIRSTTEHRLSLSLSGEPPPGLRLALREVEPGRLYRLDASPVPGSTPGADDAGAVTLESNHPSHRTLKIPVVWDTAGSRSGAINGK